MPTDYLRKRARKAVLLWVLVFVAAAGALLAIIALLVGPPFSFRGFTLLWLFLVSLAVTLGVSRAVNLYYRITIRRYEYTGVCPHCGYDLRGNPAAKHCPECGQALIPDPAPPAGPPPGISSGRDKPPAPGSPGKPDGRED